MRNFVFNFVQNRLPNLRSPHASFAYASSVYRDELNKSISAATARGTNVLLTADMLSLKDRSGAVVLEEDPFESDGYHPGDARSDFESFLSHGLRSYVFSELSRGAGFGDGDFSNFQWKHSEGFDVVGNGSYLEGHGFEITLELICPCLADGPRIRIGRTRSLESWPTPRDIATLESDINDLMKDWDLLLIYQDYLLDQKIEFKGGKSYISAKHFRTRANMGKYYFGSETCEGEWDQDTIAAYEIVTQEFSDWIKLNQEKLTALPNEETPDMVVDGLDLV